MRRLMLLALGLIPALTAAANAAAPVEKWRYAFTGAVYGGVTLADLDGDGLPEAVFGTRDDGHVYAVKGDGSELFAFKPAEHERFISIVSVADIDLDGIPEIVATGRNRQVYCLSPRGRPEWSTRLAGAGPAFGGPALADLSGDARLEIVFGVDEGRLYCLDSSGRVLWTYRAGGGIFNIPVVADVDGDGQPEILFGARDNHLYCLDGSGALAWRSQEGATAGETGTEPVVGGAAVADLNGDGAAEVLVGGFDGIVRCLRGRDGAVLWTYDTQGPLRNSISIADVSGDGAPEVLVSGYRGFFCLDGRGSEMWTFLPEAEPRAETAGPVVGDVTGDGKPDIIFGGKNGHVYCLSATGELVWERGIDIENVSASPALGDVDGDGQVEVLYATASMKGALYCLGTGARYRPETMLWPQARRTTTMDASLVQTHPQPRGQVVLEYQRGETAEGIQISFGVQYAYPSYEAIGVVQAYVEADPDTSLEGRQAKVEVTRGDQVIYTRTESPRGGRRSLVLDLPLGQLMSGDAPEHAVTVQVIGADGSVEAESGLRARLLLAGPIAQRADAVEPQLEALAGRVGTPPAGTPAEFAARLAQAGQFYLDWVRADIAAGDLRGAEKHMTGLETALPELEKRVEARLGDTTPVHAPGLDRDHIAFDENNALRVDGKPVFGYGFYNVDTPKHIETLAPEGYNVAVSGGNDEFWKTAAAHGMLVITYLGAESMEDFGNLLRNADRVEKLSREKALLAYYVADEPSHRGVSVETMGRLCQAVRILDPRHPTLICDGNPNNGWDYSKVCDMPMPASYPLWKGMPPSDVADTLDRHAAAVEDKKPVWFVIQAFTGRGVRMPTIAEERVMTYLAIIHGARGLTYFTYREPDASLPGDGFFIISQSAPETWRGMLDLAKEIRALNPVLTAPRRMEILEESNRRLDLGIFTTQDAVWLIAANPLQSAQRWQMAPADLTGKFGDVSLPFEKRSLALKDGAFEDGFEPLGVHIYRVGR